MKIGFLHSKQIEKWCNFFCHYCYSTFVFLCSLGLLYENRNFSFFIQICQTKQSQCYKIDEVKGLLTVTSMYLYITLLKTFCTQFKNCIHLSRVLKLNQHKYLYVIPLLQHNITLNKDKKMWKSVAFCLSTCRKLDRKLMYLHKISIMHFLYISTTNHSLVHENIWKSLHQLNNDSENQELLYSSPWINGL